MALVPAPIAVSTDGSAFPVMRMRDLGRSRWTQAVASLLFAVVLLTLVRSPLATDFGHLQDGTFVTGAPTAAAGPSSLTLSRLATSTPAELTMLSMHDMAALRALAASTPPRAAADWWRSLSAERQSALIACVPALIGRWDGLPPLARVAANRVLAAEELRRLTRDAGALSASADYLDYLRRAADGRVQLYLWDPQHSAVIEMTGDPKTAKSILFVVPGTNTDVSSFTAADPVTAFARWQVRHARAGDGIVAFTVMTGPMPHLTLDLVALWSNGPQNNAFAFARGREYARFAEGVERALPDLPTVSFEHSYASAIGSAAEHDGARFSARYLAASVGAPAGYRPVSGTSYYAAQAPNDINRYYSGVQIAEVGFATTPESIPGIHVLDTGLSGPRMDPGALVRQTQGSLIGAVVALAAQLPASVENHNTLLSADDRRNADVLKSVAGVLRDTKEGSAPTASPQSSGGPASTRSPQSPGTPASTRSPQSSGSTASTGSPQSPGNSASAATGRNSGGPASAAPGQNSGSPASGGPQRGSGS